MKILKWFAYISLTLYIIPVHAVIAITAGNSHSCALKNDGQVVCWGNNSYGKATPPTGLSNVQAIATGGLHTCALKNDGQVVCWGYNYSGQATPPTGLSNVQAIAAGEFHTCALKNDGQVVCWGRNDDGQATPPTGLSNIQAIAAGYAHTCALKNDSQVICWGDNTTDQATPPTGLSNAQTIAARGFHTCVLKNDSQVVCWGYNYSGQATPPTGLSNVQAIAAGSYHTCALKNDGQVVCWGRNDDGQATVPSISLLVELSNMTVSSFGDNVLVEWETGVEVKNVGFRLQRAIKNQNGSYDSIILEKFNSQPTYLDSNESCSNQIQGQLKMVALDQNSSTISAIGNSRENTCYSFIDTSYLNDGTYYYLLESIGDNGEITHHCNQIKAVTIGQGPAIDLKSAINYCNKVTGSNN